MFLRAAKAHADGLYKGEIVPVDGNSKISVFLDLIYLPELLFFSFCFDLTNALINLLFNFHSNSPHLLLSNFIMR